MTLHLGFHGAAGTVTGSRHLLTSGGTSVLVDAGMFQGLKELRLLNWARPAFRPDRIGHVVLTHAHIDHSGYLPRLVRDGFRGEVRCTPGTAELARLLLLDAAKLQEEDAAFANRKGFSRHTPALPLFTTADAEAALGRLVVADYGAWIPLADGIRARLHNAGHLLGSALVEMVVGENGRTRTVLFSGDVGGFDMPLHPDPSPPPACDILVMESTYGDRQHSRLSLQEQLRSALVPTLEGGGTVLIPAFAVGRAQQVILLLGDMMAAGTLPRVPIHLDSPMAVDATRIYSAHLRDRSLERGVAGGGTSRLNPEGMRFHRTVEDSKALNDLPGPRVIISASGMLTGGRVLHHLARLLPEDGNLILLVGYQAAGTRGRALIDGASEVKVHGGPVRSRARILSLNGLSGHGDCDELLRFLRSGAAKPRAVFVTHGEPAAAAALARRIEKELGCRTFEPRLGSVFDLDAVLGA